MSSEVTVTGLDDTIVIHRDEWGIPHARASTVHDAFVAQGFAQAEDRLGQLEYDRRRAYGRWAEVRGAAALEYDCFTRRAGLRDAARREYDALSAEARGVLDAYAHGVNSYLALGGALPTDLTAAGVTPEPWEPWDSCAVFLVRHVVFASWQKKLWRGRLAQLVGAETVARLEGHKATDVPLIVPPGAAGTPITIDPAALDTVLTAMAAVTDPAAGSNSWALAGHRTRSGVPLVAGDPHRLVEVPNVYYQCHLACPEFDAVGLAFVGVPGFPHFGHTRRVAWCVTNANGDYQDLYVERLDDATPTRTESVAVRDGEPVPVDCYETAHGPVLFGDPTTGIGIALRATALADPSPGLNVVLPMLRADTVDELDDVMRAWVDPVNNLVSADVDGHLRYRTVGVIPERDTANAWGPVPGWEPTHEWTGVVPYDELPWLRDPDGGCIVTANQQIVGPDYPHYLGFDYSRPDRARRVFDRLAGVDDATVDDMAAIHSDRRSLGADRWVRRLTALTVDDPHEQRALDALRGWDRVMDADSAPAAIYVATRDHVGRHVARQPRLAGLRRPATGEPFGTFQPLELRLWTLLPGLLAADDTTLFGRDDTWDTVLAAGLAAAVTELRALLGDDVTGWRWGILHRCAPHHPLVGDDDALAARLDPPPVEIGGEWDTVFAAAHPAGFGYNVTTASVARYVFDLADWDQSRWIVPLGASGEVTSPHFADQQQTWAAGELIPMRYTWETIADTAVSTITLLRSGTGGG
ncbi:MAG TPA: penicillin acylase family protein [Acidimicrobiia bacterium]|nr:penicillin acylase family protein [Acidimicrobiia bacterium]